MDNQDVKNQLLRRAFLGYGTSALGWLGLNALLEPRLFAAADLQYISAREAVSGARLGGFPLADATATVHLDRRFDVVAGVHNLFDRRYQDPVYLTVDRIPGDGRSLFLKLVLRVWE